LEKNMTKLENTKPQSVETDSISDAMRCHHRRPSGRRCKLAVTAPGAPFCFTHTQEFNKADSLNLKTALLTNHEGFQTAQGINHSLRNLYILLANNYISPRRAAVLAYINSLQLRTLPAIDSDNDAGITDPTAPQPQEALDPDEEGTLDSAAESEPDSDAKSASPEPGSTDTNSKDSAASPSDAPPSAAPTAHDPAPPSKYRSYWATIPDPNKKPS
jgi:hypothetical protein